MRHLSLLPLQALPEDCQFRHFGLNNTKSSQNGPSDGHEEGTFIFSVSASSSNNPVVTKMYPFMVAPAGTVLPPHSTVDITISPAEGGTATGTGVYTNGTTATVVATPSAGYQFLKWTENDKIVGTADHYTFTNLVNQSLVAVFALAPKLTFTVNNHSVVFSWPTNFANFELQENSNLNTTNWQKSSEAIRVIGTNNSATISMTTNSQFFRLATP